MKDLLFYLALLIGLVAMFFGFAAKEWFLLSLGAILALQVIAADRVRLAYLREKELRWKLEEELRETSQVAPNTPVRRFWTRIKYQRDQEKPGGPFGPPAGVG